MARKRSYRRSARRYYGKARRRAAKMTIPIAPVMGILGAPAIANGVSALSQGNWEGARRQFQGLAGLDFNGAFQFSLIQQNMIPILAGIVVHRIAGMTGINRMLAKSKIPLIRV